MLCLWEILVLMGLRWVYFLTGMRQKSATQFLGVGREVRGVLVDAMVLGRICVWGE